MSDRENQNCQGFYEVSGYTTDDGKKVDSYTRRCWKHGNGINNEVSNTKADIENINKNLIEISNKD